MEKINIAEILKDCPKGMELDCTIYDNVKLIGVDEGGEFTYGEYTPIHFEYDYGSCTDGNYILSFLTNNNNDAIKHIFGNL